jgi:hypothetical protein
VRARLGGEQHEERLTRQIEAFLAEEEEFARRRAKLTERERRLRAQVAELERRVAADHSEVGDRAAELAERERAIDERMKVLEKTVRRRARELAQEAVALKTKEQELVARERRLAAGAPAAPPDLPPPPVFQGQPQAAPPPPSAPPPPEPEPGRRLEPIPLLRHGAAPEGGWNLDRLERWIEERGDRFPGRVEEWRYYIVYMRDFANVDGILPSSFDRLVWDVFGELLSTVP